MPRHLIHSMKIKEIKIALDHYLNPLQKEKYREWFLLKKADLVKLIFENNIQDEIVKINKKLKLTPKYSVKQFPLKVLKKILIKIITPDITEDFENWAVITKPQLIKLIIKHNLENKIFEKLTAKQAVKYNVPKKQSFKDFIPESIKEGVEEGEYKESVIKTEPNLGTLKTESDDEYEEKQRKLILEKIGTTIRFYYHTIYNQKKKKGLNAREKKEFNKAITELKKDFDTRIYHAKDYFDDKGIEKLLRDFDQQIIENKELIEKMLSKDEFKIFLKDNLYNDPKLEITDNQLRDKLDKLREEYIESVIKHKLTKYPPGSPAPGGRAVSTIEKEWGELRNIALIRKLLFWKRLPTEEELKKQKESKKKVSGVIL